MQICLPSIAKDKPDEVSTEEPSIAIRRSGMHLRVLTIILFVATTLIACGNTSSEPKTRAERIQEHCDDVASSAAYRVRMQYEQMPVSGSGFAHGAAQYQAESSAEDAARYNCLRRNGIDPFSD